MKKMFTSAILAFISVAAIAQDITVHGTILDNEGYPAMGAVVLQQGTQNGSAADFDGNYSISLPADATIVVSCMGFKDQVIAVGGRTTIDITLELDSELMEEVVVVGYGTQKSKDLTAPIATVKGDDLSKQISGNALGALQGKASGVRVIQSGAPGSSPSITIRGTGSLGNYASPLYIVDGVFVDDIGFVSTDDIQDMTILKDASAAAIYGVRAANGVIIITTKKGSLDHTEISYSGYVGLQTPVNIMKLANTEQYIELLNNANANVAGYVPKNANDYEGNTDWYAALVRNAPMHNHSLDISGATDKTSYAMGIGYYNQQGIMNADNGYDRLNFRARMDQKVKSWLDMGVNVIISNYNRKDPASSAFAQAFINPPVYNIYSEDNDQAYPVKFDSAQRWGWGGAYGNPFATIYYNDSRAKGLNLVFSTYAEIKLLESKLKFRTAYNTEFQGYMSSSYTPEHMVYGTQGTKNSSMSKTYGLRYKHIIDNTLTYSDRIGAHSFTGMLGQSTRIETNSGLHGSATDVPNMDDQSMYIGLGSTNSITVTDLNPGPYRYHGLSFFTRGTYNYKDKYLASATFRADASSKYNKKWGFFPSLGAGWVISEEDFARNAVPFFEYLKFRASWGLLGNDNIPANSATIVGSSGVGSSAVFNDVLVDGIGAQTVYQNFLRWEVVNEFDFGFDFTMLSGRLTGDLDYYNRTTHNVVFNVPIATGGGTSYLLANNGVVRNSGIEFNLNWKDKISKDLSYNVGLNLTTVKNKVIALEGRDNIPGASVRGNFTTLTQVGYPIGSFWGYKIDGVYESNKDALLDDTIQTVKGKGYFKYSDLSGPDGTPDGKIDDYDKTYLGSPIPSLMTGLDFGLNWKNLDVSVSLYGQFGNKILNAKRMNRGTFSDGNYDLDFYRNAWTDENHSNKYPSAEAYTNAYTQQANTFFVEDAWFVRIQNIQAGYTFNNFGRLDFVNSLRVYVSAQRPFTYFPYHGFTTEIGGSPIESGIDTATHPMQAIYTVGLKVNFK